MTLGGPLYRRIEFCRNAKTLWHKLQSGHWDWLGVHPKGQFVLGSPRQGGLTDAVTVKLTSEPAEEGQHGVRVHHWSGAPDVKPMSYWLTDAEEAEAKYEEMIKQLEAESVVLARIVLIQNGQATDEHFIARTPPPNYR
jgi:hypothetical protein